MPDRYDVPIKPAYTQITIRLYHITTTSIIIEVDVRGLIPLQSSNYE